MNSAFDVNGGVFWTERREVYGVGFGILPLLLLDVGEGFFHFLCSLCFW